jgi:hypothetical protein
VIHGTKFRSAQVARCSRHTWTLRRPKSDPLRRHLRRTRVLAIRLTAALSGRDVLSLASVQHPRDALVTSGEPDVLLEKSRR